MVELEVEGPHHVGLMREKASMATPMPRSGRLRLR